MSVLAKLLTEAEACDPEYGGGLCNHLPMPFTALDQLGTVPDLLQKAAADEDEHAVKLCYATVSMSRSTGDRLFRWLAAREVGALEEVSLPSWRS